ncbi:MAG: lipid-A-disaccharide synthase [Halanaerobiaceae bacterium]|nr:lipid-A-disaccharide synthase [Halanaerobiaceae bacterium]
MGKIMVVTGEVSGDINAARVVREIKELAPETSFFGMGSTALREEGVEILIDPTGISTIGFTEALKNLNTHLENLKTLKKAIDREKPDVLFLVDNAEFNMLMARIARKKRIPAVTYFSPSAWIWGSWRAKWLARYRATIASVFPMEAEVYREAGAEVVFVGHPLLDKIKIEKTSEEIFSELELDPEKTTIGLLPGSRHQEIETLLPEMLKTAERLQKEDKQYQFVIPLAGNVDRDRVASMAAGYELILKVVEGRNYEIMSISDLLITASGTATLEAAIIGIPMIIVYKVSATTYRLAKKIVKPEFIGMPNIIAGKEVLPELLQERACAEEIYAAASSLLQKPYQLNSMKMQLREIRERLGTPGGVRKTAELVLRKGGLLS